VSDQEQLADSQPQVFAPPVRPDNGLVVQRGDRRIEGLEHRKGDDIDATDRQTSGMTPQMVDQRFDFG
jgi:hypothetical protein